MFSKKKKCSEPHIAFTLNDKRSAFRVSPEKNQPVMLIIANNAYPVLNISGAGVCFQSRDFRVGCQCAGILQLTETVHVLLDSIEIVAVAGNQCHCHFLNMPKDVENRLYSYVLNLQKTRIRQSRTKSTKIE